MKKIVLIASLISTFVVSSQNMNYQKELERMVKIPNTPEAEAFTKYGNTSVSMYSGTPEISIPIYTISGRELDLPISLTYDASGARVAQLASQVGLGWNLNVGGRISRIVNGLVDDYLYMSPSSYTSSLYNNTNIVVNGTLTSKSLSQWIAYSLNPPQTFPSQLEAINYFKFLKDVSDNKIDTQPDYYSFNALGYSDHFVYDLKSGTFKSLDNPRTKISVTFEQATYKYIVSWVITTEDGTKLYFNQAEETHTVNLDDISGSVTVFQDYNSSWLLTKIESPNLKDIYEFTYLDLGLSNTQPSVLTASITNEMNDNHPQATGGTTIQNTTYNVSQLPLTQITHNGIKVLDFNLKDRFDLRNQSNTPFVSGIDAINIYKFDGASILKKFTFNHSYFGINSGVNPETQDAFNIRLKLDSISVKSALNNTLSTYKFDYFAPSDIPSRESYSQDYLGYYNGKLNSVMYPAVTVNNISFDGADRSPDFNYAVIGNLKKLTYPTGGYTDFTYEANKSPFTIKDIVATTQDVTYGSISITSGIGNSADSGFCALDQYGYPPNLGGVTFIITEADTYAIDYTNTTGGGEAYLFKRSSLLKKTTVLPYNQVINQNNCDFNVTMIWLNSTPVNSVYLTPGSYQITLAKGYSPISGTLSLRIHREETTSNGIIGKGEVVRAGIRVKNIKDYSDVGVLSSEKEYQYTTVLNGNDSSGEILFDPEFYSLTNYQVYISQPDPIKGQYVGLNTMTRMTRGNSWSGGDRPHIAYAKVFEIQKAGVSNNGYIEHNFNTGLYNGVFSTGVNPNASLYYNNFSTGKESQVNVHKSDATLINTDSTEYFNTQFNTTSNYQNSTIYIHNNIGNSYSYVKMSPTGTGTEVRITYEPAIFIGFSGYYAPGTAVNPVQPNSCESPNYCMPSLDYSSLETRQTYAQGNIGGVLSKVNTTYYNGIANTQITNNTYDAVVDYLLRESQTTKSTGETLKSRQYYPKDFNTLPYITMVAKNRLTVVIQTESYQEIAPNPEEKLTTQRVNYKDWGNFILPETIQTAKGSNALESRVVYHNFDGKGNLTEASQANGMHTVYIWGYQQTQPIAKVDNATYASIASATITNLQTLSNADNDNTINEGALRTALNNLRTALPNAMVTTYTYDPLIGVTSITDAKGETIYYHYDNFDRLEYVIDKDGKVLGKNEYHYKN